MAVFYKPWIVYPSIVFTIASGLFSIIPKFLSESFLVKSITAPSEVSKQVLLDRYKRILNMFSSNHLVHFKLLKEQIAENFDVEALKILIKERQSSNKPVGPLMEDLQLLVLKQLITVLIFPPYIFTHILPIYSILNREQYLCELKTNYGLEPNEDQFKSSVYLLSMFQDHLIKFSLLQTIASVDAITPIALIEDVLQQHRPSSVELSQLLYCNRHLSATDEELDNIFKRYGHLISV
ncbi:hypothetical protein DI09_106p70 [Mitosporidium daphniae]|uniref:Uncharacterized protein n=1 Tax=Mitosporidium daphniae TaxID=1485682 RepID=A0A098VVM1_9MICR|nr:uncharacterized protein DI09_106p70 [Mitosporidium daphniae]KGG53183.1 hypothetical protein DI09_106p70 [Mitosporidium daphniae]|eukprot:XP_013239619.1 uncharacterized protein DI09_106p70 [Mitosporidium daphniae]